MQGRSGYSLVEISLALLVIGVGLLAALALFPEGLGAARRAVEDVSMATFAENVFAGLALEAGDADVNWNTDFQQGLRLMQSHSLQIANQPLVVVLPSANVISNSYWIPNYYADFVNMSYHRMAEFTYSLVIGPAPSGLPGKYARLEVWPGQYPAGKPPSRGRVFYREYLPIE